MTQIRGLINFIGDIRNCKTEEEERERVDKELAKIRSAFAKTGVGSYAKRKYMWKIMYMYILGYTVDFGHKQCVELMRSSKYSEKVVGYVGVSLLLIEHTEMLRLCIQTIKNDLSSRNEVFQCTALTCIANVGGVEFAESLTTDVQQLLVSPTSLAIVRKKAALCLLHLLRQYPDYLPPPEFAPQVIRLAEQKNIGVVTSIVSLLTGLAQYDTENYMEAVPLAIRLLHQLLVHVQCSKEYMYYKTPDPWLQIKLLRILQYYPPPKDKALLGKLQEILDRIVSKTEVTQSVNKNHADHAVLFEAMNVIIHLNLHGQDILHDRAIHKLLHFINVREGNIRYLGLDAMARLAKISGTHKTIKRHLRAIHHSLADQDVSIRKRALDLLYSICDGENVKEILDHLLNYLSKAEYGIREEMVLKIAILAEKFSSDMKWYINVVLQLITVAGDFVTEDVWHRVVQIVTNDETLQQYAAEMVYDSMQNPPVHENLVKVAGYVLGEFGHVLDVSGKSQFNLLHKHFQSSAIQTKALLLSTYMKFANMYEDLVPVIVPIFQSFRAAVDPELQQRAVEYEVMATHDDQELISQVWDAMPDFPERESNLMRIVRSKEGKAVDRDDGSEEEDDDKEDDESSSEPREAQPHYMQAAPNAQSAQSASSAAMASTAATAATGATGVTPGQMSGATPGQTPGQEEDLLGDLFGGPVNNDFAAMSMSMPSQAPVALQQDLSKLHKLLLESSGALYEDNLVQIGFKCQVDTGGIMRVILYYGNKSQFALENVTAALESAVQGIEIQFNPQEPFSVAPQQQFQQKCRVLLLQPALGVPSVKLSFTSQGRVYELRALFPVVAYKFFTPHTFDGTQFRQRWAQLQQEAKQVFMLTKHRLSAAELKHIFANCLSLGLIAGVDPNPNNIVACAVYHFATKKQGKNVTMPVLMRVEFNEQKQAARVTVRTPHESATQSVLAACSQLLN